MVQQGSQLLLVWVQLLFLHHYQTLPTLLGLSIVRKVLSNKMMVGLLSKTDPGSIAQLIQAVERAARQNGV